MSFFNPDYGQELSIENATVVSTSTLRDSTITNTNISLQTSSTSVKTDSSWLIKPLEYFSLIQKPSLPCYVVSSVFIGKQLIIARCILVIDYLNIAVIPNHYSNLTLLTIVWTVLLSDYLFRVILKNVADGHFRRLLLDFTSSIGVCMISWETITVFEEYRSLTVFGIILYSNLLTKAYRYSPWAGVSCPYTLIQSYAVYLKSKVRT